MAATVYKSLWWLYNEDGAVPDIRIGKIAASQGVYIPGAPCYQDTSGTITRAATDGTTVHGLLLDAPSSEHAANTSVPYLRIRANDVFACFVDTDGTDTTAAQANVGNSYGLTIDTTAGSKGYTTMNKNEQSNVAVECYDLMANREDLKYATTDSPGVVLVKFLAAALVPAG